MAAVEAAARDTPGVLRTAGPWSRHRWLLPEWPPPDVAGFRERALDDPLGRAAGWISADGSIVTVDASLAPAARGPELVDALEANVRRATPDGYDVTLAGLPVLERAMDRSLRRLVRIHLPALVAAAAVLLAVGFRSAAAAAAPLAFVAVVSAGVLGTMGHLGLALDMVSVVLVPLLFVISLATALHLQVGFRRELGSGATPRAAVAATYRRKGRAVIWTAVTTGIAFASFAVSPVPPVRSLGIWLASGIAWMLVAAFGLYPALLEIAGSGIGALAPASGAVDRRFGSWGGKVAAFAERRRLRILVVFGLLALGALAGAATLRREGGLLSYFSPAHPARQGVARLEQAGLAAAAAELLIELRQPAREAAVFRDPDRLEALGALADRIRAIPGVRGAVGPGDLYRAALDEIVVDGEPSAAVRWMVLGLMQGDPSASAALADLVGDDGRAARLTIGLPLRGPRTVEPVLGAVRRAAADAFPGARIAVTGELPLIVATQGRLLRTLGISLLLTVLCVAAILALIVRRPAAAVRALAPNIWAVLVVFGVMGAAGVPLDSTTVMIAAVALGLAVDDTLHTLVELRAASAEPARSKGGSALAEALTRVAPAHLLTSGVLAAGFAVCALSEFLPVARFGALAMAGVAAALAGDLLLLPALFARPAASGRGERG